MMYRRLSHCCVQSSGAVPVIKDLDERAGSSRDVVVDRPSRRSLHQRDALPPVVAYGRRKARRFVEQREGTGRVGLLEYETKRVVSHRHSGGVGGGLRYAETFLGGAEPAFGSTACRLTDRDVVERPREPKSGRRTCGRGRPATRLDRLRRLHTQLLDKAAAQILVHGQRLGLASAPVQRAHQLGCKALALGEAAHERIQLGDDLSLQSAGCSLFASSLYSKNGVQRYWTANVPLEPVTVKPCGHDHFTCSLRRSMNADAASHDLLVATVIALQGQLRADAAQQDRERLLTECTVAALRENCLLRLTFPGTWAATRPILHTARRRHRTRPWLYVDRVGSPGASSTRAASSSAVLRTKSAVRSGLEPERRVSDRRVALLVRFADRGVGDDKHPLHRQRRAGHRPCTHADFRPDPPCPAPRQRDVGAQSAERVARRGVSPHSRDQAIGSLSLPMHSDCNPHQRE